MNWLRIVHETTYHYDRPVGFTPHRLVIRPREGHDTRVEEMLLEITPDHDVEWSRDVFGNSVATVFFFSESEVLKIKSTVLMRQTGEFPKRTDRPVQPPAYPLVFHETERVVAAAYRETMYPDDVKQVTEWMAGLQETSEHDNAESLAAAVNTWVREKIRYKRREARGVQSPAETLKLGYGSCRDLATLLMEAWRVLGFPSRFASGYLDCAASEAGRASTHAWGEVYLPEVGWVGFDPTLGRLTSSQHVVTGVSNHPRGVMPITGGYLGKPERFLKMEVAVKTEQLDRPEPQAVTPVAD